MHELSLCENIIHSVDKAIVKNNISKGTTIRVNVTLGSLAGVDESSLTFWFPIVAEKMQYKALKLNIIQQEAIGQCLTCKANYSMQSLMDPCSECGRFERKILSGMEFNIKSLEV